MSRLVTGAVIAFVAASALAAPRTYTIGNDGKNRAGFRIEDTLETIDGLTNKISGSIVADPADVSSSSVEFTVDMPSLDTGIALRDREMRDHLETSKYRTATFRSVSVSGPATVAANAPADISVLGDFTLHGVTRRVVVPVRVVLIPQSDLTKSRGPGDWIHATSNFKIRMTDYGLTVPSKLVVSVANEVEVRVDVFANAK